MDAPPCPSCPEGTALTTTSDPMPWPHSGIERLILHGARQHRCHGCGEEMVSIPSLGPLCRALCRKMVWQVPRLTPRQLRFLRSSLGWTGKEIATQLHVSTAAVSRSLLATGDGGPQAPLSPPAELLFRMLVARHALQAADVWGLLGPDILNRIASEPPRPRAWMRATLLDGAPSDEIDLDADSYWLVQDADDEATAKEVRGPLRPVDGPPAAPPPTPTAPSPRGLALVRRGGSDGDWQVNRGDGPDADWRVTLTQKASKQIAQLPDRACEALSNLVRRIQEAGPVRGDWPNYGLLSNKEGHHCHLVKSRPTYVACWRVADPKARNVEFYYVGTHEKARY